MNKNLTNEFIEELYDFSQSDFSENLKLQAKRCMLDYLGVTLAGSIMLKKKGNNLLKFLGELNGESQAIGFDKKTSIENAVFLNGLSAHVAELDDGVISGIVHPGSPIFSALIPIAERERVNGSQLLSGIIIGYEAAVRISDTIQPSHKKRGFHGTGTCGAIGAAIGIASMLGFSKQEMKASLSAACISAAGSLKVLEDNSELKPYNVGRAAQAGLVAANFARAGFNVPEDVLLGKTGFLSMMSNEYDETFLKKKYKDSSIERVYVKPYAACRYCHPSIDAVLSLKQKYEIGNEDIESIKVDTYFWAVSKHDHTEIEGISSAKMSIPFSIAVSLETGKAGIDEFSIANISNKKIATLTKKVYVSSNETLTKLFPQKSPARLELTMKDGTKYIESVDYPKGEPENPLTDKELIEKFLYLANFANKSEAESNQIVALAWNLEEDLGKLFPLI